jgi:4-amino-4-deoxychorismate lyase
VLFSSVNGHQTDKISITERGFTFGDGHFTTAKISQGKIELIDLHLERLQAANQRLAINDIDLAKLKAELETIAKAYCLAVLKVVITAGSGGRGYSRQGADKSTIAYSIHEFPKHYKSWQQTGIELEVATLKLGLNPLLAGLKHLNRLEQVLIKKELEQRQLDNNSLDELLVCDHLGHIIETSSANMFWLKDNLWYTPKLDKAGVNGVMRQWLLSQIPNVCEIEQPLAQLPSINAMFICNSLMQLVPVKSFQNVQLDITPVHKLINLFGAEHA